MLKKLRVLESGIESLKDLIEIAALCTGILAIIWAIGTYIVTQKQFNFSVMISCIERFQQINAEMGSSKPERRMQAIKKYVDLCNEELFYFKNDYVPKEVMDEWIEGMASRLPWFQDGNNVNPAALAEIADGNLLKDYPRIRQAFRVNRPYNFEELSERIALINLVKQNLRYMRS